MSRWSVLLGVVGILGVSSVGVARLPSVSYEYPDRVSGSREIHNQRAAAATPTAADAMRAIRALEALSLRRHDQLLEDTQALADAYDGLVQQNADRIAEIATLKRELSAVRAELATLNQRKPSRLAHSPD